MNRVEMIASIKTYAAKPKNLFAPVAQELADSVIATQNTDGEYDLFFDRAKF